MIRNVGKIDQFIRIVAGLAMMAFVFKDETMSPIWPILLPIGAILITTAFSRSARFTRCWTGTQRRTSHACEASADACLEWP
jgi:hypothetical protein